MRRSGGVDHLAGESEVPPVVLPVELSRVADKVEDIHDVCIALRHTVQLCEALANQMHHISDTYCVRSGLGGAANPPTVSSCFLPSRRPSRPLPATLSFSLARPLPWLSWLGVALAWLGLALALALAWPWPWLGLAWLGLALALA